MNARSVSLIACAWLLALLALGSSACSDTMTPETPDSVTLELGITPTNAQLVVTVDKAPLRALPSIESQLMILLDRGQIVDVVGVSSDSAWYLVRTEVYTDTGWIFAELVDLPTARATLITSELSLRAGPGNNYDYVGRVQAAHEVQVIGAARECAWLEVIAPDGLVGWISGTQATLNVRCKSVPVVDTSSLDAQDSRVGTEVPSSAVTIAPDATRFPDAREPRTTNEMLTPAATITSDAAQSLPQMITSTATVLAPHAVVNASSLNVRSGPSVNFMRLASLEDGTEVKITERTERCDWVQIVSPEQITGWVSVQHLTLLIPCTSIAVTATTLPTPIPSQASTAVSLLPAPRLLRPDDGASLDLASVVLGWSSVKSAINSDEFYIVTLQFRHGSVVWTDRSYTHATEWPAQEHAYLSDISDDGRFNWSVQLIKATGIDAQGVPQGNALSLSSASRTFMLSQPVPPAPATPTLPPRPYYRDGLKEAATVAQSVVVVGWLGIGLLFGAVLIGTTRPQLRDRD